MSSLIPHENLNEELVILSQSIQVINVRYNVFGVSLVEQTVNRSVSRTVKLLPGKKGHKKRTTKKDHKKGMKKKDHKKRTGKEEDHLWLRLPELPP